MARPELRQGEGGDADAGRIRFDKWLWAARFYKTRSLAAQAIDAGQARLNGERVKPAHAVRAGDAVSLRREGVVREIAVTALSDRRGPATVAATLYRETEASVAAREQALLLRKAADAVQPRFPGRPTKRERRKLGDLLGE
jgi:ribosome-associated heat shock protein Hsp15